MKLRFAESLIALSLALPLGGCSILHFEPSTSIDTERLQRALDFDQGNAHAHFEMGQAMLDVDKPGRARLHFERAREIQPDFIEAWDGEGIALLDAKKYGAALDHYKDMAGKFPASVAPLEGQALANYYLSEYEDCEAAARAALTKDANSAVAMRLLGETAYIRRDYAGAVENWRAAVRADGTLAGELQPMIESIERTQKLK